MRMLIRFSHILVIFILHSFSLVLVSKNSKPLVPLLVKMFAVLNVFSFSNIFQTVGWICIIHCEIILFIKKKSYIVLKKVLNGV